MIRRLFRLFVVLSVIAVLGVAALWILTNTDFGRERSRRFVLGILQGQTHGIVKIEALHGNLLTGATMTKVSITDSAGHPFLKADSISLRYVIRNFFSQRLDFSDVVLYKPDVVVARLPKGEWNYRVLWPAGPKKAPGDSTYGWGDWVRLTNVTVLNGHITVRSPWEPSSRLSARVRDSIITDALKGGSRLYINRAPGGYQKVVTLERVNAKLPFIRWADPDFPARLLKVSALAMDAYPFRPPAAQVRGLTGDFAFNDDSLWWKGANVRLPHSNMTGDGVYHLESGDMTLSSVASPATFDDFKWIYPHFPLEGGGNLKLALTWKGATQDYVIRDADVRTGPAHVLGDVGVTIADTVFFHDANVRFTGVTTKLIEQLSPGLKMPRQGVFSGRAKFAGSFKRMQLASTDVTFDAAGRGRSRVLADGIVGIEGTKKVVVSARNLHVRLQPLQIDIVKLLFPTLPVGGTLTGVATLNGSGASQLNFTGIDIVHTDGPNVSRFAGTAGSHTVGRQTLVLDLVAKPVALAELTKFMPGVPLKGFATGPIKASGPIDALNVDTRVTLTGGGRLAIRGVVDFLSKELGYDVVARADALDLSRVVVNGPVSNLNGGGSAKGRGFKPATMYSDLAFTFVQSSVDTIGVDTISVRASIARGLATIDRAHVVADSALIDVNGQIGMDAAHTGTLNYYADIRDLSAFSRYIPGANTADTTIVRPRPRATFEAITRARLDSAQLAKRTELGRAIGIEPQVRLRVPVDTPRAVPMNKLAGEVHAGGTVTGSIARFSTSGTAWGSGLVVRGNSVGRFAASYDLRDIRSTQATMAVDLSANAVSAYGFAFDSLRTNLTYRAPDGTINVRVVQDREREYALDGQFTLNKDRNELRLANARLRFDTTTWTLARPSTIRLGASGLEVTNLELTNGPGRRIYANGLLPTKGVANFDLQVTNFELSNIAEILQSDLQFTGRLNLDAHVSGTAESPKMSGSLDLANGTYNQTVLPRVNGTFSYANEELTLNGRAADSTGRVLASVNGTVPINLALSGVTGSRLLDRPMNVAIASDSLPIQMIPQLTDVITDLKGRAIGNVRVTGTLKKPQLQGDLTLQNVAFTVVPTGTHLESVNGRVRMTGDTVFIDSIAGFAGAGTVRLGGTVGVTDFTDPQFNVALSANDAELLNNDKGEIHASAGLRLSGSLKSPYVSGQLTVAHGVVYIPTSRGGLVGAGDPNLFAVVDTSVAFQRELFPVTNIVKNLRADVDLVVNRDTWVRSRDANVEVYTEEPVQVHAVGDKLTLTGVVNADRGEYTFLSKRFQIKRGSALFIGTDDYNATLQITAEYQVKQQNVTNIRVLIGGTVKNMKISLESDAQPPLSQSDLLSYLAFGERSASLLQFNQGSLGGGQGNLLSVAGTRLAGIALGVALDEVKGSAARSLGVDVFNITTGDVPFTQGGGFDQFIKGTEVEVGKYVNSSTFVSAIIPAGIVACPTSRNSQNTSCNVIGASYSQRTSKGYRFEATYSPRYIPNSPTLAGQTYLNTSQLGAFIIREWRF